MCISYAKYASHNEIHNAKFQAIVLLPTLDQIILGGAKECLVWGLVSAPGISLGAPWYAGLRLGDILGAHYYDCYAIR